MIKIIAAMTPSRVMGNKGKLPWKPKDVPGELKWFQEVTSGCTVIMGRKTWDSLPVEFRPLPGRDNVVVSRSVGEDALPGAIVAHTLNQAFNMALVEKDVWVIGGAQLYVEALPFTDELYLTVLDREFDGDTYFPEFEHLFTFIEDIRKGEGWTVKRFKKR